MVSTFERPCDRNLEEGAEIVQLVIALPILFILIMAIVQLCVMAFSVLTLSSEAEQAAWEVDLDELKPVSGTDEANSLVRDAIIACSAALDESQLVVDNATYKESSPYSYTWTTSISNNNIVYDTEYRDRYQLGEMYRDTTAGLIEFDVQYTLPTIINLPGLGHVTVTRHVVRERVMSTRTEIR